MDIAPAPRRRGRPAGTVATKRTERIESRLNPGERRRVDVLVDRLGISDADLVRMLLMRELHDRGIADPETNKQATAEQLTAA